jgi:adenylate cyclase class IV
MREVEVKGVLTDHGALAAARARLEAAGARLVYEGRLEDRRYDTADRSLRSLDHVLRLRVYRGPPVRASLDFKGPTRYVNGFKVRDEHSTGIDAPDALVLIFEGMGYVVTREIDREIAQYELDGVVIRFECYPRMDILVEVEGEPDAIERTIIVLRLPRETFTTRRLPEFIRRFEARTGERAAVCDREMHGDYRYSADDA